MLAAAFVLCAGCYDTAPPPDVESPLPRANCGMATLRELYDGRTRPIEDDLIVVGRITSADADGNFYKSFTVEDGQGAVEVMAGLTRLDASYPEGAAVAIRLRGCALGCSRGVMQIGRMPAPGSSYATDYFPVRASLFRRSLAICPANCAAGSYVSMRCVCLSRPGMPEMTACLPCGADMLYSKTWRAIR